MKRFEQITRYYNRVIFIACFSPAQIKPSKRPFTGFYFYLYTDIPKLQKWLKRAFASRLGLCCYRGSPTPSEGRQTPHRFSRVKCRGVYAVWALYGFFGQNQAICKFWAKSVQYISRNLSFSLFFFHFLPFSHLFY